MGKKQTVNLGCRKIKDIASGSVVKNPPAMREPREAQFQSMHPEDPLEEAWHPTPASLPGESHGQRSLAGYGP